MADDVTIKFTADVSGLQQGMQQATSAVEARTSALRSGATQINASFASLSQAYGTATAKKIATVQASSDTELAIARQNEQARYDITLNGVKEQVSLVKEQAQTAQISRQQELSGLLALDTQREDIERQHLQFLQSTYQQGTVAYAAAQRRIDEFASQSALRRQEIERSRDFPEHDRRKQRRRRDGACASCHEFQRCSYGFAGRQAILEKQFQADHAHD
jgi:hypothetical protein